VQAIERAGGRAVAIKADISKPTEIKQLFFDAKAAFGGKLDIVCSNAGIEHFDKLEDVTPEDFDQVFNLNTRGQFFVAQQAYIHLSEGGRLVLTSSISASTVSHTAQQTPKHTSLTKRRIGIGPRPRPLCRQ
jgi:NAD(P)-dependent dehydrogenase (short-subunit alcohol dehydrogenase family)